MPGPLTPSSFRERREGYFRGNVRATPFSRDEWLWPLPGDAEKESWLLDLGCGYAPLRMVTRNTTRTIRLFGADYEDIVAEPQREIEAVIGMLRLLHDRRSEWDICDFRTLLPESVIMSVFTKDGSLAPHPELAPHLHGLTTALLPHHVYFSVQIPEKWKDYEEHIGKKLAYQMRAAEGRRKKQFASSFIRVATDDTLHEDLDGFFRLHTARWQAKGHSGHFSTEANREGFRARCRGFLALGQLRLYTLWLDGVTAAALFTLADDRRIYYHSSGFDTTQGKHHPTKVLIAQAIKDGLAHGPGIFDFMKGEEDYKRDWANDQMTTSRLILARKTPRGLSALAALKIQSRYKEWKQKKSNAESIA